MWNHVIHKKHCCWTAGCNRKWRIPLEEEVEEPWKHWRQRQWMVEAAMEWTVRMAVRWVQTCVLMSLAGTLFHCNYCCNGHIKDAAWSIYVHLLITYFNTITCTNQFGSSQHSIDPIIVVSRGYPILFPDLDIWNMLLVLLICLLARNCFSCRTGNNSCRRVGCGCSEVRSQTTEVASENSESADRSLLSVNANQSTQRLFAAFNLA